MYRHIERNSGLVTLGRIEYIAERDLRIVTELTNLDMHLVENPELIHSTPYTICGGCVEVLREDDTLSERMAEIAEEFGVEIDEVFEDPEAYGLTFHLIPYDLFMVDSEPDVCAGCESPFNDDEVIITLTLVDLLDAEPVAVERRHYDTTATFLCVECGYHLDSL